MLGNKRYFIKTCIYIAILCAFVYGIVEYYDNRGVQFRTAGTVFQIYKDGKWRDFLVRGVNMGAAKPGCFPGDLGITKSEYLRWFREIAAMNANTIRVYTILGPDFYEALYEYNMFATRPLYVFHGVWNDEDISVEHPNGYDPEVTADFENEIRDLIDVLHGNKTIAQRYGHASGTYIWDVSPYIIGYILGVERDADFVINTNEKNPSVTVFDGDFLYTKNASPYECWLAQIGDYAIGYETGKYHTQKLVSWTNWVTTDPLEHLSDPGRIIEDIISVDTEHIKKKNSFGPGLFASYHIYPYYPEFMSYDPVYTKYIDEKGKANPYGAYLRDLHAYHTVPLLVAEFGIPSSRGMSHENVLTGYNQGFVTEKQAGVYIADLFDSIVASGCCGGLIFSWQDEWSKKGWNIADYDLPMRRPFWSNAQASEQGFGILTFDPGEKETACRVDGDIAEWKNVKPISHMNGLDLSVISDEKYMYFLIRDEGQNIENNKYAIAVSGLKDQGNYSFKKEGLTFHNPAGECIIIDGKDNSEVYVDAYYDLFYRQYSLPGDYNFMERNSALEVNNSGIFDSINLILRYDLTFPLTGIHLPFSFYETGKLMHGNANPDSKDYNSLADFYINPGNGSIEMRIPWQLLNVADPSTKTVIGDLYAHDYFDISPVQIDGFTFELYRIDNSGVTEGGSGFYSWEPWDTAVQYHERLKESYSIIKNDFAKYQQADK